MVQTIGVQVLTLDPLVQVFSGQGGGDIREGYRAAFDRNPIRPLGGRGNRCQGGKRRYELKANLTITPIRVEKLCSDHGNIRTTNESKLPVIGICQLDVVSFYVAGQ